MAEQRETLGSYRISSIDEDGVMWTAGYNWNDPVAAPRAVWKSQPKPSTTETGGCYTITFPPPHKPFLRRVLDRFRSGVGSR